MNALSIFLSLRYLYRRKLVFFSIAAVAMSCALLIVISSLFSGFIEALETSASRYLGDVVLSYPGGLIRNYPTLVEKLRREPEIEEGTGVLMSQGLLLLAKGDVRAVVIWGIDLPGRAIVTPLKESLIRQKDEQGEVSFTVPGQEGEPGCLAGIGVLARPDELTDEYDMDAVRGFIGQRVILTSGSAQEQQPRSMRFFISDAVFTGVSDFDDRNVYIPIDSMAATLYPETPGAAHAVHIKAAAGYTDQQAMDAARRAWDAYVAQEYGQDSFYGRWVSLESSRQLQADLVREYRKQMGVLLFIFTIVSSGVVLLVFCIFYMIVMTKRRDIAIIKSCGMSRRGTAMIFVLFGLAIGVTGALLGLALGLLITYNVNTIEHAVSIVLRIKMWKSSTYMFSRIPHKVVWPDVAWIMTASAAAAVLGALLPALRAASVRPVRLLRYE